MLIEACSSYTSDHREHIIFTYHPMVSIPFLTVWYELDARDITFTTDQAKRRKENLVCLGVRRKYAALGREINARNLSWHAWKNDEVSYAVAVTGVLS